MSREKIQQICENLDRYHNPSNTGSRVEPLLFLHGKERTEGEELRIRDITLTNDSDLTEVLNIISKFSNALRGFVDNEHHEFDNFLDSDRLSGTFYHPMTSDEMTYLLSFDTSIDTNVEFGDFLKNKLKNKFWILNINLNESGTERILLMKSIKNQYYVKKKFIFNPFNRRKKVRVIDNKKDFILDENFEICAYIDESNIENSFFFITDKKKFEDLFGYHRRYEEAYNDISSRLNFIDWSNTESTLAIQRKCYRLNNFSQLNECISKIQADLQAEGENASKRAFRAKRIVFSQEGDNIRITPSDTRRLRSLLKILTDGIAKTHLLGREGIAGDFEAFQTNGD